MELWIAEKKAKELINKYCPTWRFRWDGAKCRFGCCKVTGREITLSRYLVSLNNESEVIDTVLHEIAHAIAFEKHNEGGHGRVWKTVCLEIGASPSRCYDAEVVERPRKRFKGVCPTCRREIFRHRRRNLACGKCCNGIFNSQHKFVWTTI